MIRQPIKLNILFWIVEILSCPILSDYICSMLTLSFSKCVVIRLTHRILPHRFGRCSHLRKLIILVLIRCRTILLLFTIFLMIKYPLKTIIILLTLLFTKYFIVMSLLFVILYEIRNFSKFFILVTNKRSCSTSFLIIFVLKYFF